MKRKKAVIAVIVIAAVAVCAALVWVFWLRGVISGTNKDKVYVEKVSDIAASDSGVQNRYSGVVEAQETAEIEKNEDREIAELYVSAGDAVEVGTPLFLYDTKDEENELAEKKLDLEETKNEISNYNSQIASLQRQMAAVSEDEKFNYLTEIQSVQLSAKEAEYTVQSTEAEIAQLTTTIEQATVTSTLAGIVKSINESGMDEYGNAAAYITIMAVGDYRVKGMVNEQNRMSVEEGMPVVLHSRVNEDETWTGTVTEIDLEHPESSSSDYYYDVSASDTTTSSKYPFYVALDSTDGLMLGQHLYLEMDEGQTEEKEGIWLFSSYIFYDEMAEGDVTEGEASGEMAFDEAAVAEMTTEGEISGEGGFGTAYVWADDGSGKLEKREVVLGEYDMDLDEYEILSGLTEDDYIAWPMEGLYEGVATVTDEAEIDYDAPLYSSGEEEEGNGDEGGAAAEEGMLSE